MKNLKMVVVLLLLIGGTSCKKFLDLRPEYLISDENFFRNANDFQTALTGAYGTFRGLFSSSNILYMAELTTDNTEIQWSSPSVNEMQLDQSAVTPTNTYVNAVWRTCLTTVSRCNTILGRIEKVDMDETVKNQIIGETKFLRAYSYFYLVRFFGNVPLTFEEFTSPEQILSADLSLQPKEKVYDVIIADLTSAESILPSTLNTDKTRASIGSVETLLGKVYLTLQKYDSSATELKKVIDQKQYTLAASYKSLFAAGNENLSESILEIDYVSGQTIGNNYSYLFSPSITSMALFPNNQQGAGRIVPTLDMINAYEPNDQRKTASVSDSVSLIDGSRIYDRYGLKFVDFSAVDVSDGSVSFTVLRYADVLLMYAEALNELNQPAAALPYVNMVRQRAGLSGLSALSQVDLRAAIDRERRVEFLYEGKRWFDLLRTGRALTVMNNYYQKMNLKYSLEDYELLFPIPQSEIDLNAALKQNTGY